MCVLQPPFSKLGDSFAISTKQVTVLVPVSKFTLLETMAFGHIKEEMHQAPVLATLEFT